jgi:hypothetical protein
VPPIIVDYLITVIRARIAAVRSDRGALSLEWVVIAIVLVATAAALAGFLTTKLHGMEGRIGNG